MAHPIFEPVFDDTPLRGCNTVLLYGDTIVAVGDVYYRNSPGYEAGKRTTWYTEKGKEVRDDFRRPAHVQGVKGIRSEAVSNELGARIKAVFESGGVPFRKWRMGAPYWYDERTGTRRPSRLGWDVADRRAAK